MIFATAIRLRRLGTTIQVISPRRSPNQRQKLAGKKQSTLLQNLMI